MSEFFVNFSKDASVFQLEPEKLQQFPFQNSPLDQSLSCFIEDEGKQSQNYRNPSNSENGARVLDSISKSVNLSDLLNLQNLEQSKNEEFLDSVVLKRIYFENLLYNILDDPNAGGKRKFEMGGTDFPSFAAPSTVNSSKLPSISFGNEIEIGDFGSLRASVNCLGSPEAKKSCPVSEFGQGSALKEMEERKADHWTPVTPVKTAERKMKEMEEKKRLEQFIEGLDLNSWLGDCESNEFNGKVSNEILGKPVEAPLGPVHDGQAENQVYDNSQNFDSSQSYQRNEVVASGESQNYESQSYENGIDEGMIRGFNFDDFTIERGRVSDPVTEDVLNLNDSFSIPETVQDARNEDFFSLAENNAIGSQEWFSDLNPTDLNLSMDFADFPDFKDQETLDFPDFEELADNHFACAINDVSSKEEKIPTSPKVLTETQVVKTIDAPAQDETITAKNEIKVSLQVKTSLVKPKVPKKSQTDQAKAARSRRVMMKDSMVKISLLLPTLRESFNGTPDSPLECPTKMDTYTLLKEFTDHTKRLLNEVNALILGTSKDLPEKDADEDGGEELSVSIQQNLEYQAKRSRAEKKESRARRMAIRSLQKSKRSQPRSNKRKCEDDNDEEKREPVKKAKTEEKPTVKKRSLSLFDRGLMLVPIPTSEDFVRN